MSLEPSTQALPVPDRGQRQSVQGPRHHHRLRRPEQAGREGSALALWSRASQGRRNEQVSGQRPGPRKHSADRTIRGPSGRLWEGEQQGGERVGGDGRSFIDVEKSGEATLNPSRRGLAGAGYSALCTGTPLSISLST